MAREPVGAADSDLVDLSVDDLNQAASRLPVGMASTGPRSPAVPPVRTIDEHITYGDAIFRRDFARKLFWLLATTVILGPFMMAAVAVLAALYPDKIEALDLLEKSGLMTTSLVGTVAGIFGTVMGFYFGAAQARRQGEK